MCLTMLDDPHRRGRPEAWQLRQLGGIGGVDVDRELQRSHRRSVVVNQASAVASGLADQPGGDRQKACGDRHGHKRLHACGQRPGGGGWLAHVRMVVDAAGRVRCDPMKSNPAAESRMFHQMGWSSLLADHVAEAAAAWLEEDLGHECDWTSVGLIPACKRSELDVVARSGGVIAGIKAAEVVVAASGGGLHWESVVGDGGRVTPGTVVARISGPTRSILTAERVVLNVLGRMSGVASATRLLVDAVTGTNCRIYDTRKTVPGWRLLDKYAVRLGGGWNHRLGLYDAILIKDNHLAALAEEGVGPAEAVRRARGFVQRAFPSSRSEHMVVEIEIDSLDALEGVLDAGPDVVLLDNMAVEQIAEAVAIRDRRGSSTALEASGGIRPETVGAIARTGVDRASTGWPTHHAPWLDVALDW